MRIEVSPADLARCRFGISPLGEVRSMLWLLSGHRPPGALGPWLARVRVRYGQLRRADPAVGTPVALQRRPGFNADFIHPPPTGVDVSFAEELAMVRATPAEQARAELARNLSGHRPPPGYPQRILASSDVVDQLACGPATGGWWR